MNSILTPVAALLIACLPLQLFGQADQTPEQVVAEVVKAAETLLETLNDDQKQTVMFEFTDEEQRERWSNLPVGNYPRAGLRMGDLSEQQKEAVNGMIKATMSEIGYQQVIDNVISDEVLRINSRRRTSFGKDEFFVAILGEPSTTKPWMWQFGGHHLAINATIVGDQVTLAPSLTGGQPVDYEWEGREVRQLAEEEDAAYELINSFSEEQLKIAVLGDRYVDLNFGPGESSIEPANEGIKIGELDEKQQTLAKQLIQHRIDILNPVHAKVKMEQVTAELSDTYFAWYGPTEAGEAATFRIQGPSLIIEYSPQRLGGQATNHLHAMYREPANDYGVGFIQQRREANKNK